MLTVIAVSIMSMIGFVNEPNKIEHIQFWGNLNGFYVIEEYPPRVVKYRAIHDPNTKMDPNVCKDFTYTVDNAQSYMLNGMSALHWVTWRWLQKPVGTNMDYLNILSRYWVPVQKVSEPKPVIRVNADLSTDTVQPQVAAVASPPPMPSPKVSAEEPNTVEPFDPNTLDPELREALKGLL